MTDYLLLASLLAVFALLFREGLWGNTIAWFNVVIAGLVATNYFEPMARWLTGVARFGFYFYEELALGLLFTVTYTTLRMLAGSVSPYRVRFHPIVENAGGIVMALLTGWAMVCFLAFALDLAPLSRTYMSGSFDPTRRMFFGLAPDRLWLGFMQQQSQKGLGTGDPDRVFDPKAELMLKYASRRGLYEKDPAMFAE